MTLQSFELVIKAKVPDDLNEEDVLDILKGMITDNTSNTSCSVSMISRGCPTITYSNKV